MTSPIYFEVDPDVLDQIVGKVISEMMAQMKKDLAARKKGAAPGYLHQDPKEDILIMQEHIKAFTLILNYFSPLSETKDVDQAKPNRARTRSGTRKPKVRGRKKSRSA